MRDLQDRPLLKEVLVELPADVATSPLFNADLAPVPVRPRIAVTGLNPHADDGGLLGSEDEAIIRPTVASLKELDVVGPISAEAAFTQRDRYDAIVAMYHDQGLVPLKALWFGGTVNWTLGLPFVRTSVDHGTADDLVGTGRADARSMEAALGVAERLAGA